MPDVQKLINLDPLGNLRLEQQRYEEAEAALEQAVELSRELNGRDAPRTGRLVKRLAQAVRGDGREAEAVKLDAEAERILSTEDGSS